MTSIDKIEQSLNCLNRGALSIAECENELEAICTDDSSVYSDLDARIRRYTYMKRYCWRRLLKTTKIWR